MLITFHITVIDPILKVMTDLIGYFCHAPIQRLQQKAAAVCKQGCQRFKARPVVLTSNH